MHPPFEQADALTPLPSIRHGFFGRQGGLSDAEFATLNVSLSVGDDAGNVKENAHRAVMALKAGPLSLALASQVHGTDVLTVGPGHDFASRPKADALVTNRRGIALGVLTADCVPVLMADPEAGVIGAAHAGWRGAVGNIVGATWAAMQALGATAGATHAAIGPAISPEGYEVGEAFAANIQAQFPQASPFIVSKGYAKPHFDVPGLVLEHLSSLGLAHVGRAGGCTLANPDLYFSHRHATLSGTRTGRQISLIARV